MSIDKLGANDVARTYLQNAETARAAASGGRKAEAGSPAQPVSDQVSLSEEARALAAARKAVAGAPDVRENRVADVKQRVQDGTYTVEPRALARRILEHLTGQQ